MGRLVGVVSASRNRTSVYRAGLKLKVKFGLSDKKIWNECNLSMKSTWERAVADNVGYGA